MDYKKVIEDGREIRLYENNSKQDVETGHFTDPGDGRITTSERGRELQQRRKELARERAVEGITEAAIEAGLSTRHAGGGDGWRAVVKHVTKTLLESTNLRGQAEAANFLGKAAGLTVEEKQGDHDTSTAIAELFSRFIDRMPAQGRVIDHDE